MMSKISSTCILGCACAIVFLLPSVADPDPYVFGPPGSDPDPLVRGTDPDPAPSIIKQK
jgi:hypothetical protein